MDIGGGQPDRVGHPYRGFPSTKDKAKYKLKTVDH